MTTEQLQQPDFQRLGESLNEAAAQFSLMGNIPSSNIGMQMQVVISTLQRLEANVQSLQDGQQALKDGQQVLQTRVQALQGSVEGISLKLVNLEQRQIRQMNNMLPETARLLHLPAPNGMLEDVPDVYPDTKGELHTLPPASVNTLLAYYAQPMDGTTAIKRRRLFAFISGVEA